MPLRTLIEILAPVVAGAFGVGARLRWISPRAASPPEAGRFPLALTGGPDPVVLPERSRFQHLEIIGASGTGKNYHGLLPLMRQDLARRCGVLVLDPKGSMRPAVESYARSCRRLKDLRVLDLADPMGSDGYNPFVGDDPLLVAERVHAAFYSEDATATPYYRDLAQGLLYGFFGLCHRLDALPTPGQLRSVALDQGALASFAGLDARAPEARELRRRFLRMAPRDYAERFQGLANALTPLCLGALAPALETVEPGLVLAESLERGGVVYVGLAADQYPGSFRRVSTLLLMDLQACLTRRYGAAAPPCFVYIDELADVLYPQFRALIAKSREARVGLTVAHQALGDLGRRGTATAEAVFGNTANKILLRQGSPESAEELARLFGEAPEAAPGGSSPAPWGLPGSVGIPRGRGGGPKRRVVEPTELLNLEVGEAFLVVQGARGRGLGRVRLPAAPPWTRGRRPRPAARRLRFRPLVLGGGEPEDLARPDPGTELGRAALARLGRRRGAD